MNIARPVQGYRGLVEACRARANELQLSRIELDRIAGLPQGYSAKLLGHPERAQKPKRMWPASLGLIIETLGLQIIIIEDYAATSRTLARRAPVEAAQQRFDNKSNSQPKLLLKTSNGVAVQAPKKKPAPVMHSHLRVIQQKKKPRHAARA